MKQKFIDAYNLTVGEKNRIIKDAKEVIKLLTNTKKLDTQISELEGKLVIQSERIKNILKENSKTITNAEKYNSKYKKLSEHFDKLKNELDDLKIERNKKENQSLRVKTFVKNLISLPKHLSDWDDRIWRLLVESATVHRDSTITFKLKNGTEIES